MIKRLLLAALAWDCFALWIRFLLWMCEPHPVGFWRTPPDDEYADWMQTFFMFWMGQQIALRGTDEGLDQWYRHLHAGELPW